MIELLAMLAAAAVAVAVVEALVRRAEFGAALLLGAALLHAILVGRVPSVTLPGDVVVRLHDVVFALVLAAGMLRMLRMRRFSPLQRWMVLLCVVLLLSLVRGAMAFGPQQAIAELRLFLAFVSGALDFATFAPFCLAERPDRQAVAGDERPPDDPCLPALAGHPRRDRSRGADRAVRRRRGHQGAEWALHVLPRQCRPPHGAVLAGARQTGAAAAVAGDAAAAIRGAAEPAHRLAYHDHRDRRAHGPRTAVAAPSGRDGDRRRPAHRRGVRRPRGVQRRGISPQAGGEHRHAGLADPRVVSAAGRPVEPPHGMAHRRAPGQRLHPRGARVGGGDRSAQLLCDDTAARSACWDCWRSSRSPSHCCARCGGPRQEMVAVCWRPASFRHCWRCKPSGSWSGNPEWSRGSSPVSRWALWWRAVVAARSPSRVWGDPPLPAAPKPCGSNASTHDRRSATGACASTSPSAA